VPSGDLTQKFAAIRYELRFLFQMRHKFLKFYYLLTFLLLPLTRGAVSSMIKGGDLSDAASILEVLSFPANHVLEDSSV